MGVDLKLLVVDGDCFDRPEGDTGKPWGYAHTMLECFRRNFEPIMDLEKEKGKEFPGRLTSYVGRNENWDDACYGDTEKTSYDEPVKFILAADLAALFSNPTKYADPAWKEDFFDNEKNRAVWAFVAALDPYTKIALYWH